MNAIQRYQYDRLQRLLKHLQNESEFLGLPIEHTNEIVEKDSRLKQLYIHYHSALLEISQLIKRYEQEQKAIKTLVTNHKNYRRKFMKKAICKKIL
jgi:hypothetical protein